MVCIPCYKSESSSIVRQHVRVNEHTYYYIQVLQFIPHIYTAYFTLRLGYHAQPTSQERTWETSYALDLDLRSEIHATSYR